MPLDEAAQERAILNAQLQKGRASLLLGVDNYIQGGGDITSLYGSTPAPDTNFILDWVGASGGLAKSGDIKKALGSTVVNMTSGTVAGLIEQSADRLELEEPNFLDMLKSVKDMDVKGVWDYITSFSLDPMSPTLGMAPESEYFNDMMERLGISEKLRSTSNSIKEWNKEFLINNDLALGPDEQPTLLYNVVSGGTSLLASLGIGLATKSPKVAATVFGTIQQTDAYAAYREAGTSVEKAQAMSTLEGLVVGWLEMVGLGQWMNTIIGRGSSPLRGAMRGAIVNFQEEFAQAGAEEFFRKTGGINDNTALESLKSMFGQGVTGAIVGAPIGGITGPMETRGIKKAMVGGDYKEALGEIWAGRIVDDQDAELEIRLDAAVGDSKTEAGRKYAESFQQIAEISRAFNDGVDISKVYETEEQRKQLVDDVKKYAEDARQRSMSMERGGRRRILKKQEVDALEKLSSIEKEGADFVEGFLENVKGIGYSEETIQAIEDAIYMVGLAQESAVEAVNKGADSAEIEFSDIMEFIDEAELREEIDTLREDMIIDDAMTSTSRYINIQRKSGKLREKLRAIREELSTLEETPDAELESIVGKEYVKIRGNVIEKVRKNEAVNSFMKGFRLGKKFTGDEVASVQSAMLDGIDSLRGTGVSDKLIDRISRRIPRVKNSEQLASLIDKMDVLIEVDILRSAKKKSIEDTRKIIKKNASHKVGGKQISKLDARISDAVNLMYEAQKKITKGTKRKKDESISDYHQRKADKVMQRFSVYHNKLVQMASREQGSPMPDSAKTVAISYITSLIEKPTLSEQIAIEQSVRAMVGLGRDVRNEAIERKQVEIDKAKRAIANANKSTKKRDTESLRTRIMDAIRQPGDLIVKSYNTLLHELGMSDIPLLNQMEDLNMKNAENRINNDNRLIEVIKETVGPKYFSENYHEKKSFSRDDITIGKRRVIQYLEGESDIDAAKYNVIKYIGHRSGQDGFGETSSANLRRQVSDVKSIDELSSIVDNMVDDIRSSYSIDWTKGEHIYWYMLLQNEQIRESITAPWGDMAMPEDLVSEIESEMTEQDKQLADALFKEYENMYYKINEVYRRMYGTDLPKVDFYTPISREAADGSEAPLDPVNDFAHYLSASFTKVRTANAIQIKDQDAVDVYIKHVRNAQHWVDYAEWFEKVTSALDGASREIISKHGRGVYNVLREHINDLESASNIDMNTRLDWLDYFRKTFMLSTLGANPQIGIKQLTSIFALSDGMSSTEFVGYINEFMENPVDNFNLMRQHVTWKYRGEKFNKELDVILNQKKMAAGGKFTFQDLFMLPIRIGDGIPVYLGGYAQFRHAQKNGKSTHEALNIAAKKVEASQQTSIEANLSLWQKKDGSLYKTIGMFTSSPLALLNMELQALYQYKNGDISYNEFTRKVAVYHVVIPAFFTWVASAFDADEEEYAKSFVLGTTGSVPIFSAPIDLLATKGINIISEKLGRDSQLPYYNRSLGDNPIVNFGENLLRVDLENAVKDVTSGNPVTMSEGISAIAKALDGLTTIPSENMADMTTGLLKMFSDNEDPVEGGLQLLGFSEYILDQDER